MVIQRGRHAVKEGDVKLSYLSFEKLTDKIRLDDWI